MNETHLKKKRNEAPHHFPGGRRKNWYDSVVPSRRGIPLRNTVEIDQDDVDVITLDRLKLIKSVRDKLNALREDQVRFTPVSPSRMAIVVPYRNRKDQLGRFLPFIANHLKKREIPFRIIVVEQMDKLPFNRAALLNVGAQICREDCDFFCFHDVDLLPGDEVNYMPGTQPLSLISERTNEITHQTEKMPPHFFGGVTALSSDQFFDINGFSNRFWGWGFEDDNFLFRCLFAGLQPCRRINSSFREMNHLHATLTNIHGETARNHEMAMNRKNLHTGKKYQSRVKRNLGNPWENGVRELSLFPIEMEPVFGMQRVGVDCTALRKAQNL